MPFNHFAYRFLFLEHSGLVCIWSICQDMENSWKFKSHKWSGTLLSVLCLPRKTVFYNRAEEGKKIRTHTGYTVWHSSNAHNKLVFTTVSVLFRFNWYECIRHTARPIRSTNALVQCETWLDLTTDMKKQFNFLRM